MRQHSIAVAGLLVIMTTAACASLAEFFNTRGPDGPALMVHGGELGHCQEVGRTAPDGGHIQAYDDCKKEAGIQ